MRTKTVGAFVEHCIKKDSPDAFEVFRLVLPQTDSRVYLGMSQHRLVYLVTVVVRRLVEQYPRLVDAVSTPATVGAEGGKAGDFYAGLFRWQDKDPLALALGEPSELSEFLKDKVYDAFCGDLAMSDAEKDLAMRMKQSVSPTVSEVNVKLDELSDASSRHDVERQVDVFAWFMQRLSSRQMMWLTQIVLKRTRVWIKEGDVLEQAPWGESAVTKFYAEGRSFDDLLRDVGGRTGGRTGGQMEGSMLAEDAGLMAEEGQAANRTRTRTTRQAQVVMGNVGNAFMYMERRFKPGNYLPMSVLVDATFDGLKVRIRRVRGEVEIELSDDDKKKGMRVCDGTVVVDAMARLAVGEEGARRDDVDFDIEADIVAWNRSKECGEPRFILEALIESDRGLHQGTEVSSDMQPSYSVVRDHLEILVLVTDVISYGDESMLSQYLQIRQECFPCFPRRRWDAEHGFRLPVHVMPLVPGTTQVGGVLISDIFEKGEDIKAFGQMVERMGARGVMLRAPEAEWNTVEKLARVQVLNSIGLSIVECVVMGFWRKQEDGIEGRVCHWLLGLRKSEGAHQAATADHPDITPITPILKLRNHLHIMDEQAALESLGSNVAPFPDPSSGLYTCSTASVQDARTQVLVSVAGSLLAPGRWSPSPLILVPTLLGISPCSSVVTSMDDIERMIDAKRTETHRDKMPSVRFRDRKVADRFIPCHKVKGKPPNRVGVLQDYNVYFVNYSTEYVAAATRYQDKKRCEELVEMLGGTLSQSFCQRVNLVIAGRPTFITNKFREMHVDIMTVAWLEKTALRMKDSGQSRTPPAELPGFLPEDYLPEWKPEEARRKNAEKNFIELFTTSERKITGKDEAQRVTEEVQEAKRIKPTVPASTPPRETTAAGKTQGVQSDAKREISIDIGPRGAPYGVPLADQSVSAVTEDRPRGQAEEPARKVLQSELEAKTGKQGNIQAVQQEIQETPVAALVGSKRSSSSLDTTVHAPATQIGPIVPTGAAPSLPSTRQAAPSPQVSATPSSVKKTMSLKERAAAVGAVGISPAPSQPATGKVAPLPDASEGTKKLSLRDRAKRLGLGKK